MKHIAHGMSMTGWMLEFESEETEKTKVWNDAASRLDDTETRIVEQTNRLIAVHGRAERCGMCPVPVEPMPAEDPNEGKGDEEPQPKAGDDPKDE